MTDKACFLARLEFFQAIMQDFQQCSNLSQCVSRDQGFFLHGRLMSFFYCLLRRSVSRNFYYQKEIGKAFTSSSSLAESC